jgi:GT2 family glycosyltransferase
MKFDAYVTSDFMWTALPRGSCRIQMFHGVGGKYGFDAPTESLRAWHRLLFVNRRRLVNCVAAGALDADSPAIRLVGMPKVDCLVDGSLTREGAVAALGLPVNRPTVLYAPTWSPASSLNAFGFELIERLAALPINLIVKLHDRSRDLRPQYSGGIDWVAALTPRLEASGSVLAAEADICRYLAASDVMVTDHSSAGFEYLLLDRPIVRIHLPELIRSAAIHPDYVALLGDVSENAVDAARACAAVERALADPSAKSATRRAVAADLFHEPGTATARCAAALYEAIGLERPHVEAANVKTRPASDANDDAESHTSVITVPLNPDPTIHEPAVEGIDTAPGPRNESPAVSVIMPAYNAEAYLATAVESVLAQTYRDFELLIIDDGSSDRTAALAYQYAQVDPRVRLIQRPNAGPGPARNTGFRAAGGRLFAFLDSDDEWDARFLAEQVAVLDQRRDIDVLIANARNRGGARDGQPSRPASPGIETLSLSRMLADEESLFIMAVFRRTVVEAVGGFDPAFFTNEEYEMWLRAALAGFRFARNPLPLGWYRCRPDSLSAGETRMLSGILRVFARTRSALPPGAPERIILERQVTRFEAELAAAEARLSLARGDGADAARHLSRLYALRGGWLVGLAAHLPAAAVAVYRLRERARRGARPAIPA